MRANEFVLEDNVIYSTRFKQKQAQDFQSKIQKAAADVPALFTTQAEWENEVKNDLLNARQQVNRSLLDLRVMAAPLYREYRKEVLLPEVIVWELDGENKQLALSLLQKYRDKIIQSVQKWIDDIKEILHKYSERNWPVGTNWQRYTPLPYDIHEAQDLLLTLKTTAK